MANFHLCDRCNHVVREDHGPCPFCNGATRRINQGRMISHGANQLRTVTGIPNDVWRHMVQNHFDAQTRTAFAQANRDAAQIVRGTRATPRHVTARTANEVTARLTKSLLAQLKAATGNPEQLRDLIVVGHQLLRTMRELKAEVDSPGMDHDVTNLGFNILQLESALKHY